MKKSKLITPLITAASLSAAVLPIASCSCTKETTGPKIIECEGIKVTFKQAKVNETLIIHYEMQNGYLFNFSSSYIKIGGQVVKDSDIYYIDEVEHLIYIKATAVTSNDIEVSLVADAILDSIYASGSYRKTYAEFEKFDTTNLTIKAKYVAGFEKDVDLSQCTFSPSLDTQLALNTNKITVTYQDKQCEIGIQVEEAVESIAATGTFKTKYEEGEKFDTTGLVIKSTNSAGFEKTIDLAKCTFSPSLDTALTMDTKKVTVTYANKSVDIDINVDYAILPGLVYTLNPDNNSYSVAWDQTTPLIAKGTLPTEYNGKPVDVIGDGAFTDSTVLEHVIIPEGYTYIGQAAFAGCTKLAKVEIPSTVQEIADCAFSMVNRADGPYNPELLGSELTDVTFAKDTKLQLIGSRAFEGTEITSFEIPKGVISIGSFAFAECAKLQKVDFTNATSLQVIGEASFLNDAALTTLVKLENTVLKTINDYAFAHTTNLAGDIKLPSTIYKIENYAFTLVDDTEITTNPLTISFDKYDTDCNLRYLGSEVFFNRTNLTSIVLPKKLQNIGAYDFAFCTSLTALTIPYSVCRIGWSFYACVSQSEQAAILYGTTCKVTMEDHTNTWGSRGSSGAYTYQQLEATTDNPLITGYRYAINKDFRTDTTGTYTAQMISDTECLIGLVDAASTKTTETVPSTITVDTTTVTVKGVHVEGFKDTNLGTIQTLDLRNLEGSMEFLDVEAIKLTNTLTTIYFPDSIKYFGHSCLTRESFNEKIGLKSVGTTSVASAYMGMGLPTSTEFIDDYAFFPKNGDGTSSPFEIYNLQLPSTKGLYIGDYAFYLFPLTIVGQSGSISDRDWVYGSNSEYERDAEMYTPEFVTTYSTLEWSNLPTYLTDNCQYYYLKVN